MAWDFSDSSMNLSSGAFDENVSCPSGNAVTGGGYAILQTTGASFTSDPNISVVVNGPNGSGSWRVAGFASQSFKLVLQILSS